MRKKQLFSSTVIKKLHSTKGEEWVRIQEKKSLALFHEAASRVPAYKDFLRKNKINHEKITSWEDFQYVPPISKKNYLRNYPLSSLCWDGSVATPLVFTSTSGSTGEPVYFVRNERLDWQYSLIIEDFLRARLGKRELPILVIICFGMGIWIGGLITYKAFEIAAKRCDFPISLITPGINKKEIFNALRNLSPQFSQTILIGYPPFIKDIIDEASYNNIDISSINIRFFFAAEAITEAYRDYLKKHSKLQNIYLDTLNIYGSADIGAMAHESTIGILIKRLAKKNEKLFADIFSPINKTPTLAQFNPFFINFEATNQEILITGNNAMPLVRYAIGDHGGVLSFPKVDQLLKEYGYSLKQEAKKVGIDGVFRELPFVYVYERNDLSATFYGLLIYPEWIREALYKDDVNTFVTGKFTLVTNYDRDQNQILNVHIELKKDKTIAKETKKTLLVEIMSQLRKNSSEYRELSDKLKSRALPKLHFWPAESQPYFQPGIKQKWVKKT